ncbi:Polynucleotide adenylyltransferase region [Crinalium epipsammum PCC 9333]|uniref:Polynucleotide adenylyltransferase region n=1 Tax=Crinalium epipsammum PCC 9333 TaxID=1173022 RepID=K9VZ09_9CYAN|nr:CBS domain-containing protein [Crinalium epipsammum]AFZ12732.1 Polynucleotide adenylyltransferase region [Crinalium epipsammum PCC 9333]
MDLILCHTTADFDALGAAVGLTLLQTGAKVVLTGGAHPAVRDFLALYRDEFALIERRSVNPKQIRSLIVVDTQLRDRTGKAAEWFDLPHLEAIQVYDHHLNVESDIPATFTQIEPVGATTTLIVEQLQQGQIKLTSYQATVMALGIHVDTGSLTFEQATARDALALAWLMGQGAQARVIAEYIDPGLSPQLQSLLTEALDNLEKSTVLGYTVSWVLVKTAAFIPGLSSLASQIIEITESDALLLACVFHLGDAGEDRLIVIGRSRIENTNLNDLFQPLGGGGHSQAASLTQRTTEPANIFDQLVEQFIAQIPQPLTARELMSSPVRTIRPQTTIEEAQRILLRYGHSGLSVVNEQHQLVGIISRRDIDLALHHGFSHAPVKGYMTTNVKTIKPNTLLPEIESLMVTYDIGRLPVIEDAQLIGIVTRTDVLRQLHQDRGTRHESRQRQLPLNSSYGERYNLQPLLLNLLRDRLVPELWNLLSRASEQAEKRGWHLYLVGGAVRDLLIAGKQESRAAGKQLTLPPPPLPPPPLYLQDIDLVVDGFHRSADVGAGVELAKALQTIYPEARLDVHGSFQTAALLWHKDEVLGSLWVDIATARTEFYPYPAANPEVEASSIRQDLYRRDFTINALAVRLTPPHTGELLDFFGGLIDIEQQQIRVLHANSFIEDPTRIYRAVRFAVRLGFEIEPQTEGYIRYAIASGIYDRSLLENSKAPALQTRLKAELKYILQATYWASALQLLASLEALKCLHPTLELNEQLWKQIRLLDRWLRRFDQGKSLVHWQMRLEVLIAHLAEEYRGKVAENLQLPMDSIQRLQHLAHAHNQVVEFLSANRLKSEIVQLLRQYELRTLILIAIQSKRFIRRTIWEYLTILANIQSPLSGNDLKQLGYQPGKQYKQILDKLLAATLDGYVTNNFDAQAFLAERFPVK